MHRFSGILTFALCVVAAAGTSALADTLPTENAVSAVRVLQGGSTVAQAPGTSGTFSYLDAVSVTSYLTKEGASGRRAYSEADLDGVSLFGGIVSVSSVKGATYADARTPKATGAFGGAVGSIVVAGTAVSSAPGTRFDIPNIGYGVVDERVVLTEPGGATYRAFDLGLDVHVTTTWNDIPAGTELQLGYADAGATVAPTTRGGGATPTTTPTTSTPTPTTSTPTPHPLPAPVATVPTTTPPHTTSLPIVPALATPGQTNLDTGNTTALPKGIESYPPGGFTASPPIDPLVKSTLLGPDYIFPVAGGARFSNDFGASRVNTGSHQGIDLFASIGTPVLAVHDGTLHAVGWNHLGGHRLWLEDTQGNWFYYAHLSAYAPVASEGAKVSSGEIIGYVGNTGDAASTPYHLHFEIHPAGKWAVPPFAYVSAWIGHTPGFLADTQAPAATVSPSSAFLPLGSYDISSASGLDPASVVRAADLPNGAGDETTNVVFGGQPPPSARAQLARTPPGHPFDLP